MQDVVGTGLIMLGAALSLRSAMILLGRGRPHRGPRPSFVIAGPYRRLRNPLWFGLLLIATGTAVVGRDGQLWIGLALLALLGHAWIVLVEEPRLRERFGETYVRYLECVPRWFPSMRVRDEN